MLLVMKTLHFFGLMLGAAGSLGTMTVAMRAGRAEGGPPAALLALRPYFTRMTLAGVALLWLSGLWLWLVGYGGTMLGTAFALKLLAALFILGVSLSGFIAMKRAVPGTPPPPLLRKLGPLAGLASFLAVALAVYVFG